jgi:hypothetical protein
MSNDYTPTEPRNFGDLYPGRFIAADSSLFAAGAKPTFTIARVLLDELQGEKGAEVKVVVVLQETPQAWVLPKICGTCLAAMFGKDVSKWAGKRVTLWATNTIMPFPKRGTPDACIRVWGSPDIASDIPVAFTPARRKPINMTMHAMGGAPDYVAEAEAAVDAAGVKVVWSRANKAGHLTDDLRDRLTAIGKAKTVGE